MDTAITCQSHWMEDKEICKHSSSRPIKLREKVTLWPSRKSLVSDCSGAAVALWTSQSDGTNKFGGMIMPSIRFCTYTFLQCVVVVYLFQLFQ